MSGFAHVPVLYEEVGRSLITDAGENAVYVDGTLGGGGHAQLVLSSTRSRLVGIDRDPAAIAAASRRLAPFDGRFTAVRGNFADMPALLSGLGVAGVTGILLDLGVSSYQFDEPSRGFSYQHEAPLDMRMDPAQELSAADVINGYSLDELTRVLRDYGEERHAFRIARAIVAKRPIATTTQLCDVVVAAMPGFAKKGGPHPARRTFQGVRIEVNGELDLLPGALAGAFGQLLPGGRLAVITFHSLEDRIVKEFIRERVHPCTCPPKAPMCVCGKKPTAMEVLRGGAAPGQQEMDDNPRARSARLRVAQRL